MKQPASLCPARAPDAQYQYKDQQYKRGPHGLLLVWRNGTWVNSGKTEAELLEALQAKRRHYE